MCTVNTGECVSNLMELNAFCQIALQIFLLDLFPKKLQYKSWQIFSQYCLPNRKNVSSLLNCNALSFTFTFTFTLKHTQY